MSQEVILRAIRERRLIECRYNGRRRICEPHLLGEKGGVAQLLAFQVDGVSTSDPLPSWRRFEVARMAGTTVLTEVFSGPREVGSSAKATFDRIVAVVE